MANSLDSALPHARQPVVQQAAPEGWTVTPPKPGAYVGALGASDAAVFTALLGAPQPFYPGKNGVIAQAPKRAAMPATPAGGPSRPRDPGLRRSR